jgi:DNA-binding NarL/FixJ family response regulator
MVTTDPSQQLERDAKRAGIKGLCPKSDIGSLFKAVETVIDGGTYFTKDAAA